MTSATPAPQRVLTVGHLAPDLVAALDTTYDVLTLPTEPGDRREFLRDHGSDVPVAVTSGRSGVDEELMDSLPQLGAIVSFGVGHDRTDVTAASRRGILVSNTPDVLTDCVADATVGLVIDVLRGLSAGDRYVRQGRWPTEGHFALTKKVTGRRIGILGLGSIGRAVATRLEGFRCDLWYHSRRPVKGVEYVYATSARDLASAVDVLVVTTPGGEDTRALVDREVLTALGPDGFLVNVSRGSVIDEEALIELLTDGRLGGAGLDVFADEPNVRPELVALENVVLLPHLGSGTVETRAAMEQLVLQNIAEFFRAGTLLTPVREQRDGHR